MRTSSYSNAMEPLVKAEVAQQLENLPKKVIETIDPSDAIAYALNRLPPLYATTEVGLYWQQQQAQETLTPLIIKAVSWGIKAAQRQQKICPTSILITNQSLCG
ncbi:MAG: late competence development ComFB family protein [Oscillatoria sp. PMC 1068.18]|nr:late competence development ComFB family protein [Oscillatoria sp. PMC 1076.18]MEC4990066.1 late competence development ComFB family protein [Oscillatoria sp. PMC 1068.18]